MNYLKELVDSRELLSNLVLREVRGQYKRTIFGRLWSLASPLAQMLIYTFVFAFIFRVQPDPGNPSGLNVFALWLLCGLLPWTFFSSSLNVSMGSLVVNAGLITKVYFPRIVLPLAAVGSVGFNWLFEMLVLVVAIILVGGIGIIPWLPFVVLMMVVLALFAAGLGLMLSIANAYFRDTQYLLTIVLQIWMYLTPIVYPVKLVAEQSAKLGGLLGTNITVLDIYTWNPMYNFVEVFRQLMYDQRWPDPVNLIPCLIWAALAMVIGVWVFGSKEKRMAEIL